MSIEPILLSGAKDIIKNINYIFSIKEVAGSILSVEGFQILEKQSMIFHGIKMEDQSFHHVVR